MSLIDSVVPYTTYTKISDEPDYCFVIYFFNNGEEENFARSLIDKIYTERVISLILVIQKKNVLKKLLLNQFNYKNFYFVFILYIVLF